MNKEEKPKKQKIRVFTAFSGYDSQMMAMYRLCRDYPDLLETELVGWSEIDEPAIASHNAVFPEAADKNYGDISNVDWSKVPDFDLFTYSSPCQDFSISGAMRGGVEGTGTRSSLLWECRRTIETKRPKYCILENVKNLVSDTFRPLFLKWKDTVDSFGYHSFWKVLNASDLNVPQGRERVFLVSIRNDVFEEEFGGHDYIFPSNIKKTREIEDFFVEPDQVPEEYYFSADKIPMFLNLLNHAGEEFEENLEDEHKDAISKISRRKNVDKKDIRNMSGDNGLTGYVPKKKNKSALF